MISLKVVKRPLFFLYCAYVIYFTAKMEFNYGDDVVWAGKTDFSFWLWQNYYEWGSRVVIGIFVMPLCQFHLLFQIVNVLALIALPFLLHQVCRPLLPADSRFNLLGLAFALVLMYPLTDMDSAGWIVTSGNYLYPLAAGLFCLTVYNSAFYNEVISWPKYLLFFTLLIFAANLEQLCLVLTFVTIGYLAIYYFRQRRLNKTLLAAAVVCLISLAAIILAPGNYSRLHSEVISWRPDFYTYSTLYKIYLGHTATMQRYFFDDNFIFIAFTITLAMALIGKYSPKTTLAWAFALLPAGLILTSLAIPYKQVIDLITPNEQILDAANYHLLQPYLLLAVGLFIMLMTALYLYTLFDDKYLFMLTSATLLLGYMSRMVMSFSPTLFASGTRTFILMDFSIIIVVMLLFVQEKYLNKIAVYSLFTICALLQVFNILTHPVFNHGLTFTNAALLMALLMAVLLLYVIDNYYYKQQAAVKVDLSKK